MNLDPAILKQITLIATGFSVAFLAALWLSLIFWVFRDIRTRTRDPFMRVLAVIVSAVLFLPGVIVYLIIRPSKTIEEEYQHTLEEEALLQAIEDATLCPACSRHVQPDWLACPTCHTRLKKKCEHCGKTLDLPWDLCPYCEKTVSGMQIEAPVVTEAPDEPADQHPFQRTLLDDDDFLSHP
jgi:RNA polymerase subunit RPABC4/transcription elongation factor Spt4